MQKVARIKPLKLQNLKIGPPLLAAPMAGYSNPACRLVFREFGAGMCVTEMVSSNGLFKKQKMTHQRLKILPREKPVSIQVFGGSPEPMAAAARIIEMETEAAAIDINMGCPVKKVTSTGYGVALMSDPKRAVEIVEAMKKACTLPITVKIRTGPRDEQPNCVEFAMRMQDAGADAVALHPRSQSQKFQGYSQWEWIGRLVEALNIPVIGNGDIQSAAGALRMIELTGCHAVMIGRSAIGNPAIFTEICEQMGYPAQALHGNLNPAQTASLHFEYEILHSIKPDREYLRMRKSLPAYFSASPHFDVIREQLLQMTSNAEVAAYLKTLE